MKDDYLVFAAGTTTNFYGNANIEKWAIPMKTVSEAMGLRNAVLSNLERALRILSLRQSRMPPSGLCRSVQS